jgi:hypothetical protein
MRLWKSHPKSIWVKINTQILPWIIVAQSFVRLLQFSQKTSPRKQSPNMRKFAQTGHPVCTLCRTQTGENLVRKPFSTTEPTFEYWMTFHPVKKNQMFKCQTQRPVSTMRPATQMEIQPLQGKKLLLNSALSGPCYEQIVIRNVYVCTYLCTYIGFKALYTALLVIQN